MVLIWTTSRLGFWLASAVVLVKRKVKYFLIWVVLWYMSMLFIIQHAKTLTSNIPTCHTNVTRSRPNWIAGPGPKSASAGKSESHGPENGVSRWWRPNLDIYSHNYHFGLVYDVIYQFLGMEANNYKFGMFCQQCHPSVAPGDADIWLRNASPIQTCHLFTS